MSDDTIHLKKDTVYQFAIGILVVLLVVSIVTGGFGMKSSGAAVAANTGAAANANAQAGANAATTADVSAITGNSNLFPSIGPDSAKNVVIELADFQCPYCALASGLPNWTSQYSSQYGALIGSAGSAEQAAAQGQIKFIFVPLSFLGQESVNAAQAAYCAENQGKFWQLHDAIYKASGGPQEDTGKYSVPNLEKIAAGVSGIDTSKFNSCLENNDTLSQVNQAMAAVQNAGFQISTPQFWVNGQQVSPSWSAIQAAFQ